MTKVHPYLGGNDVLVISRVRSPYNNGLPSAECEARVPRFQSKEHKPSKLTRFYVGVRVIPERWIELGILFQIESAECTQAHIRHAPRSKESLDLSVRELGPQNPPLPLRG